MPVSNGSGWIAVTSLERRVGAGERVRRLRLAQGLGQVDLAERVGLTSGSISMLENGRLALDDDLAHRLARALDCEASFFARGEFEGNATRPWLRAYADAPAKTVDRFVEDSLLAVEAAQVAGLSMMPDLLPGFDGELDDDEEIERFAVDVRGLAGVAPDAVLSNAVRAAERLGVLVLPMDDELGRHLGMSFRVNGRPVIRVSRSSVDAASAIPGDRQRFTIAHELGHLTLHQVSPPPVTSADAARIEKQAHRFAGAFLAPGDALIADLERLGGQVTLTTLAKLKAIWGVAIKALVVRFGQLGVIDSDHARSLHKQISARRWNRAEPVEVGNEKAIWFTKAIETKFSSRDLGVHALSEATDIGTTYIERWIDWSPTKQALTDAQVLPMPARVPASRVDGAAPGTVTPLSRRRR